MNIILNKEQIKSAIENLAKSQGFYGRVLEQINEHPEWLDSLEKKGFKDVTDLVLYLET